MLNYRAMLTLYNNTVLPYLSYCCELWGNTYKSRLNNLVFLQKRAIRIVHGAQYRDLTDILFSESKIHEQRGAVVAFPWLAPLPLSLFLGGEM